MAENESNFNCGPLDNSMSPTMCWIYAWQIHSHNASLIYACPQVYPIIINEAGEIWVRPAICTADRPRRMKKYSEDNGAVCVTKWEFDLELCDNSYLK